MQRCGGWAATFLKDFEQRTRHGMVPGGRGGETMKFAGSAALAAVISGISAGAALAEWPTDRPIELIVRDSA